jgi:hypothetical protein
LIAQSTSTRSNSHDNLFPIHTIESAPEGSKPALKQLQSAFGMIPNLIGGYVDFSDPDQ